MKLNKILKQNNIWLSLITIIAIGLAIPIFGVYADLAEYVGKFLFYVLFFPFISLFRIEMMILPIIAQFNNFTNLPGIINGWKILRDVSNMFFIVVLLVMAFATILKISGYGYKELLKNLIIMAILVNFSKTITGLLIDIGQVVMLTFVAAIKDVAAGNLTEMFGINSMVRMSEDASEPTIADSGSVILAYLLGGVMVMLASIILMAFIVMLVMRIIYLWFLVIVSPLAFVANAFPSTKKYFSEWLSNLGKEIMIGPVLIFFLWLSLTIMNSDNKVMEEFKKTESVDSQTEYAKKSMAGQDSSISFTEAGKWDNILKFIIAMGILIGSLGAAKTLGSKAMAIGDKAASKMKSGIDTMDKKFGIQKATKLATVGASGEGGLKGFAIKKAFGTTIDKKTGEAKMSLLNRGLARVGGKQGQRAAMRLQGFSDATIAKDREHHQKIGAQTRDPQRFHELGGGKRDKALALKAKLAAGKALTEDETREATNAFTIETVDKDAQKMLKKQGHYFAGEKGAEKAQKMIEEDGIQALKSIHTATIDGEGGKNLAKTTLAQIPPAQIEKFLKSLSIPAADAWKKAFADVGIDERRENNGIPRKQDESGQSVIDKNSVSYAAATISPVAFEDMIANGGLNDLEINNLTKDRMANMGEREILGIDPSLASSQRMMPHLNEQQTNQLAANGSDAQFAVLMEFGNLVKILSNPHVQHRNKDADPAQLRAQINTNITNNIQQVNKGSSTPMDSGAESEFRIKLAASALPQAHLMLSTDELMKLIERLDVNRAQQIDSTALKSVLPNLSANMQEALAARGIGQKIPQPLAASKPEASPLVDQFNRPIQK